MPIFQIVFTNFYRHLVSMIGGQEAWATAGKDCSQFLSTAAGDQVAFGSIGEILSTFASAIILLAGIGTFLFIIFGGIQYLTSGGDKAAAQSARERITYAILGLAIVAAAIAINQVLGAVFGVNIFGIIKWPAASRIVGDMGACI